MQVRIGIDSRQLAPPQGKHSFSQVSSLSKARYSTSQETALVVSQRQGVNGVCLILYENGPD